MPAGWSENQLRALRGHHAPARTPARSGPQQRTTRAPGGGGQGPPGTPGTPGAPGPSGELGVGHIDDWITVTGTSEGMVERTGYLVTNASLTTLTLPTVSDLYEPMAILGKGAGLWTIAQNAGQSIWFGRRQTTVGVAGFFTARAAHNTILLRCITADLEFEIVGFA